MKPKKIQLQPANEVDSHGDMFTEECIENMKKSPLLDAMKVCDMTELAKDANIRIRHSIGMRYEKISLAINNPEHEKEIELWNKYFPLISNP